MSKHKYPQPDLTSTLEYLPEFEDGSVRWRLALMPTAQPHKLRAVVEVYHVKHDTSTLLLAREGEDVGINSLETVAGAWFRAAFRLSVFLEGKATDDLIKWAQWHVETDKPLGGAT